MVGINTNLGALNARQSLEANAVNQSNAMQQLSTGLRINSAKDDAAGLAIATKMNSNIKGVAVAVRNANDGISMAQTAESALGSVTNMLQRMRELSVQASNGTLTSSNRASMQLEVKQLASEIDNIGKTANFNGIKLFDGSASQVSLQTNINAGDVVKMSVGAMNSNLIGLGSRSSLTAQGIDSSGTAYGNMLTNAGATLQQTAVGSFSQGLSSGDLVINGFTIGSSVDADDSYSVGAKASSAISKVAAINKSSGLTGVVATVGQTVASGIAMTVQTTAAQGTLTINGVTTDVMTLKMNSGQDRKIAVDAINAISTATGVRAVDTGNDSTGVQLVADDGRNIIVNAQTAGTGTFVAVNIGVNAYDGTLATPGTPAAANNIFTGTFTLASNTSSPITIGTTTSGDISHSGLAVGTYAANTSAVSTTGRVSLTAGQTAANSTSLASGVLVINGTAIGASVSADDTASAGTSSASIKAASAIAIAAAINKSSSTTGVRAVANANTYVGKGFTAFTAAQDATLYLNGQSIAVATSSSTGSKAIEVVNAINAYSNATGVVASDNGQGITLTAADGRNIELSFGSGNQAATLSAGNLGLTATSATVAMGFQTPTNNSAAAAATYYAGVTLISDKSFTVSAGAKSTSGTNNALTDFKKLGFQEGSYGGSNNGSKISAIDISTLSGASDALSAVDAALGQISDQRSNLGAIQNRLQSAVDNLTSSSTNLQSAQGRIQDTDYSSTTTQMSKSQIIAQAATAMLAQANQQPQMVLSLLK